MWKQVEPLVQFLDAGPPQQAGPKRARSHEHMLEPLVNDPQLVDRPEQPLKPRFRHQRRHAERPHLFGVEAETSGKFCPRESRGHRGTGSRRDRVDFPGSHAQSFATSRHGWRRGDHPIGLAKCHPREGPTGPHGQMADEPHRGHQQLHDGSWPGLRATPGEDRIGSSQLEPAGQLNQSHDSSRVDGGPRREPVDGHARM